MKERKKTIRKFTGIILMIFSLYSLAVCNNRSFY